MKKRLSLVLSMVFAFSMLAENPAVVNAEDEITAADITAHYSSYQKVMELEDGDKKTELLNALEEAGFVYDDFSSYPIGTVKSTMDANKDYKYNGGIGFAQEWKWANGYDPYVPSILAVNANTTIGSYGPAVWTWSSKQPYREFAKPIDTSKNEDYYISLQYREHDSGNPSSVGSKFIIGESGNETVYAEFKSVADKDDIRAVVTAEDTQKISDEKVIGKYTAAGSMCYGGTTATLRLWKIKIHISARTDGEETIEMKVWDAGKDEPAEYNVSLNKELGEKQLNRFTFKSYLSSSISNLMVEREAVVDLKPEDVKADYASYQKISALPYSYQKAELMKVLAETGFAYDDFSAYPIGTVRSTMDANSSYKYNGGIGFAQEWKWANGYDPYVPSILAVNANTTIGNYGPAVWTWSSKQPYREFAKPIDTSKNKDYYISLQYREHDSGNPSSVGSKFIIGESGNETVYAEFKSVADKDDIRAVVTADGTQKISDETVINRYTTAGSMCYGDTTATLKVWNIKIHIAARADSEETVEMKIWQAEKEEPAEYNVSLNKELGEKLLNRFTFKVYLSASMSNLMLEHEDASDKLEQEAYENQQRKEITALFDSYDGNYTKSLYDALSAKPESKAKTEYMKKLAEGFVYDPINYEAGVMQTMINNGYKYNGGIGFADGWTATRYAGDRPSVTTINGDAFFSNYIKDISMRRNLNKAIDTTKDGEYYFTLRYRDTGNLAKEIRDTRFSLGENIFAGIRYDAEQQLHFVQGSLDGNVQTDDNGITFGQLYNGDVTNFTAIWDFVVNLSVDADGEDTLKIKMWREDRTEPADWTMIINGEAGTSPIEYLKVVNGGSGVCFDEPMIESCNTETVRDLENKIAKITDLNELDGMNALINSSIPNGTAKTELLLSAKKQAGYYDRFTAENFKYVTAEGTAPKAGDTTVMAQADLTNTYSYNQYVKGILAVYKDGKLAAVTQKDITAVSETPETVTWGFDGKDNVLTEGIEENMTIRAFIWNSLTGMEPIFTFDSLNIERDASASLSYRKIYVDPQSDGENETFKTITEAKNYARKLIAGGEAFNEESDGIMIEIGEGVYNENFTFTAGDSGAENCPVIYKNANGARVKIIGGTELKLSDFNEVTGSAAEKLSAKVRNKVKCIDLKKYTSDYGRELAITGHSTAYYRYNNVPYNSAPYYTLSCDGADTKIAQYPNDGFLNVENVVESGTKLAEWNSSSDPKGFVITETNARMANWEKEENLHLWGYWSNNYSDLVVKVKNIGNNTIESELPQAGNQVVKGQNFIVYNALCELDSVGEWYIDSDGILYFYPPENAKNVVLGQRTSSAVSVNGTENVIFDGLEFEGFSDDAINVLNSSNIVFRNVKLHDIGGLGIRIQNGCTNCSVKDSEIYYTGTGGIALSGGAYNTLEPAGNIVENCDIHDFARLTRAYSPAVHLSGVGNKILNCKMYNSPHMAIRLMGNDNVIDGNEIYNCLTETYDAGVIYAYQYKTDRGNIINNNYFHDFVSCAANRYVNGNSIYAVYFDEMFDGAKVTNNTFENIDGYGVFINGGRDFTVTGNTAVNVKRGIVRMSVIGKDPRYGYSVNEDFLSTAGLNTDVHKSTAYSKYPHMNDILDDDPLMAKYNVIKNNRIYNSNDIIFGDRGDLTSEEINAVNTIEESEICGENPLQ